MKTCTTCGAEWPDDTKFCPSDGSPLRVAQSGSLIGGVLKSFHIIDKLGEGGMGTVYLGEHVKMGRKSAIKVLTESLAQDAEAIARFNREATNASRINHPNVCGIYDFGETDDGLIFLAMEFIEGEALTDLIVREGPLGPFRAATIIRQAGDALQAAHDLGIVHRDLKPDNIMIAKGRGGEDVVKVVDFGIAKAMGGEEGQKVTRTGLVVGTPEYMSPEQLSGDVLDGRSDIYSLALVLFRMLTGQLPFEADSAQEVMIKRLTDEPITLNTALAGGNFPGRLQQVLDHALQRMPSDRYASASEFAKDVIAAVSATQPQQTETNGATQLMGNAPSTPANSLPTEELKKTRISAARPTVPMGQPGDRGKDSKSTPQTPMPRPSVARKKGGKQRKKTPLVIAASAVVVAAVGGTAAVMMSGGTEESDPIQSQDDTLRTPPDTSALLAANTVDSGTPRDNIIIPPAGGDEPAGGETPVVDPDTSDDSTIEQPTVNADSIAIERQIDGFIEPLLSDDPAVLDRARREAEGIFYGSTANAVQKAQVAFQLAGSYNLESTTLACAWIGRALDLAPDNQGYRNFEQRINCSP